MHGMNQPTMKPTENPPANESVTCRECRATYVPSFMQDFYQDDKDGPGTGLCEQCMMNEVFNKDPVPVPSEEHCENVCKRGKGADACIFLCFTGGFACAKGSGMNNQLVQKAQAGLMTASSCNCDGPDSFAPKAEPTRYPTEKGQQ